MSSDEIQSIRESLARIETALMGDPAMGNAGLVRRVTDLERESNENTLWRAKVAAISSVVAVAVTAIVQGVYGWLTGK